MVDRVIGTRIAFLVCIALFFAFGCKSKEQQTTLVLQDSAELVSKTRRKFDPPFWNAVTNSEGETLQVAQIAEFSSGCPRAGDPDVDGKFRDGCPLRADKWNDLLGYADSIKMGAGGFGWSGYFKNNIQDDIECKAVVDRPVAAYLINSIVIFHFVDYYDSIDVRYHGRVAFLDFRGYVNPLNRGYPKAAGGDDIADGGMRDEAETILILKAARLEKIVMTSSSGVIRGDYHIKDQKLIPVSKKSVWPCSPVISTR